MAAQTEKAAPDTAQSMIASIELLTENGYSILRRSEIEGTPATYNQRHEFLVRSPDGFQRTVVVEIQMRLATQIQVHTLGRISFANSFWLYCAERHLADFLWERERVPDDGKLLVEQLTTHDLNLARRWETT